MDGFEGNSGVIVVAATNRADTQKHVCTASVLVLSAQKDGHMRCKSSRQPAFSFLETAQQITLLRAGIGIDAFVGECPGPKQFQNHEDNERPHLLMARTVPD